MFILVAGAATETFTGEVARRTFDTLEEAEKTMRDWGRFGVENLCSEAKSIRIFDQQGQLVKTWNRRLKQAVSSATA
jgi:hypothetical protein